MLPSRRGAPPAAVLTLVPFVCRAKELKALFGSLLQKTDHTLNSQAKKHEKLK